MLENVGHWQIARRRDAVEQLGVPGAESRAGRPQLRFGHASMAAMKSMQGMGAQN
jgi:hypothetical protein